MDQWYAKTVEEYANIFVRGLQAIEDLHQVLHFPGLQTDQFFVNWKAGRKYARVYRTGPNQTFVECFIDKETGDVLKPAGWQAPAKGARGNITTPEGRMEILLRKQQNHYGYLYK